MVLNGLEWHSLLLARQAQMTVTRSLTLTSQTPLTPQSPLVHATDPRQAPTLTLVTSRWTM